MLLKANLIFQIKKMGIISFLKSKNEINYEEHESLNLVYFWTSLARGKKKAR